MENPSNTNYDVRKAILSKKGLLKIKAVTTVKVGERYLQDSDVKDRDVKPHPILISAFDNLIPHALLIAGIDITKIDEAYLTQRKGVTDTKLRGWSCYGFELKTNETEESVKIFLRKKNTLGFAEFNVGFIKTKGSNTGYPFSGILDNDVTDAVEEVIEFLNGKDIESDQLNLDLKDSNPEPEEEDEEIF